MSDTETTEETWNALESAAELVPTDELEPHPRNEEIYGEIDPDESFRDDIDANGVETPIVVNTHEDCPNTVIGGHRRLVAAEDVGFERVPVRWVSYPEPQATRRVVLNNKQREKTSGQQTREMLVLEETARGIGKELMSEGGKGNQVSDDLQWQDKVGEDVGVSRDTVHKATNIYRMAYPDEYVDEEYHDESKYDVDESVRAVAREQVEEMDAGNQSFNGGYEAVKGAIAIAEMDVASDDVADTVDKEIDDSRVDVSKGDIWVLGDHILYCGDTSEKQFKSIVADHTPCVFGFADPPYGADVAEWDSESAWNHDYLSDVCDVTAVTPGIVSIFDFAMSTSMPYRWSIASWIKNGMTRGDMGFGNWIYVALFADEDESLHSDSQDICRITIDTGETGATDHKGRKPSDLMVWLIDRFSDDGDVIVDPFAGSGSTLFAAEETNRQCVTGEIDPSFCAAIIERWNVVHPENEAVLME